MASETQREAIEELAIDEDADLVIKAIVLSIDSILKLVPPLARVAVAARQHLESGDEDTATNLHLALAALDNPVASSELNRLLDHLDRNEQRRNEEPIEARWGP